MCLYVIQMEHDTGFKTDLLNAKWNRMDSMLDCEEQTVL